MLLKLLKSALSVGVVLLFVSTFGSWFSTNHPAPVATSKAAPVYDTLPAQVNGRFISLPPTLSFAGEPMPLSDPDVRERMDREIHINTYWHTNTILMLKRAHRWLPVISKSLAEAGVPDDFKYIVAIETNFKNDTSPRNAVGFWQFLKASGKEHGLEITAEVDERYSPEKATKAAASYLKHAYEVLGSWTLAAASYNRGITGIMNAMQQQKDSNYYHLLLNEETSRYVFRIVAAKLILEHPEEYGFIINSNELYQPFETETVEVTETIPSLVDWAQAHQITYRQLKRYNPWLRATKLTVVPGKTYLIALPK